MTEIRTEIQKERKAAYDAERKQLELNVMEAERRLKAAEERAIAFPSFVEWNDKTPFVDGGSNSISGWSLPAVSSISGWRLENGVIVG